MAHAARLNLRLQKELKLLLTDPPPGASFPFLSDGSDLSSLSTIDAQIEGPEDTVYTKGIFHIKIQIPERYPFQPPIVAFATPIYHPNIDNGGRICLDILNLPPKGAWQPSLNISTVITSIGLLLREPNPDDGLMREASREYKYNRQAFDQKARFMTEKYARTGLTGQTSSTNCSHSILNTEVEVRRHLEESNCIITDSSASEKKPFGIKQKLSIESSSSTNKKDDNEVVSPDLPFDHKSHMGAEEGRKGLTGTPDDVCDVIGEKLCGNRKKLSLGSTIGMHKREDHVTKDEKSKHLCSSPNLDNVSTGTTHKKLCLVDRKLALESRSLYKRQEDADKENAMPFKLLTSSNSKGMEKPEIGQNVGGGHLVQLQGCNEDSNGVYLHSLKQQHESERQEARLEKEAEVGESVIVLDSEESDEEESSVLLARRSKLSLGRRCVAKRKTKA